MLKEIDRAMKSGRRRLDATLASILAEGLSDPDLLKGYDLAASRDRYSRHLVYQGEGYSLLAIVWLPGQMSPVHSHRVWCALGIYRGWLNESSFRRSPKRTQQTGERQLFVGDVSHSPADLASGHRMANIGTETAVSIHVYPAAYERLGQDVNHVWAA
jgi:predicted metal-dependent enzyme (double-stranded beta helix superfamily)